MSLLWEDALRGAGLRVTQQRLAVLDVLHATPHAEADDIVRGVREREPQPGDRPGSGLESTSAQTVYGVLAALEESGLVRRIELPGSNWRYETRVDDNHHHLVCRGCGRVEDVECVVGHAPCLHPAQTHGFTIDTADVVFTGLCADCARAAA